MAGRNQWSRRFGAWTLQTLPPPFSGVMAVADFCSEMSNRGKQMPAWNFTPIAVLNIRLLLSLARGIRIPGVILSEIAIVSGAPQASSLRPGHKRRGRRRTRTNRRKRRQTRKQHHRCCHCHHRHHHHHQCVCYHVSCNHQNQVEVADMDVALQGYQDMCPCPEADTNLPP